MGNMVGIMVGGMQMSTAALLWSSLCSPPAPSAEWRWATRTKQGWLTGRATPGPWIQRKSKSALGNLCLAWFPAPIIFPPVKAAGSGEFRRSISTAFREWSYLTPHLCSEFLLLPLDPPQQLPAPLGFGSTRDVMLSGQLQCGWVTHPDATGKLGATSRCSPHPTSPNVKTLESHWEGQGGWGDLALWRLFQENAQTGG